MTPKIELINDLEQALRTLASLVPDDSREARAMAIIKTDLEKVYAYASVFLNISKTDSTEK